MAITMKRNYNLAITSLLAEEGLTHKLERKGDKCYRHVIQHEIVSRPWWNLWRISKSYSTVAEITSEPVSPPPYLPGLKYLGLEIKVTNPKFEVGVTNAFNRLREELGEEKFTAKVLTSRV